jgi:hypothetical protein
MTTQREERESLKNARAFLLSLLVPKETPGVPGAIRKWSYRCLRHYPAPFVVDDLYAKAGKDCR